MKKSSTLFLQPRLAFLGFFLLSLVIGGLAGVVTPARAEQPVAPAAQTGTFYTGIDTCANCHKELVESWKNTRHANAFSSPIFQRDWSSAGSQVACLSCHTTGFNAADGSYYEEGVTCEGCHGPLVAGHPANPMSVKADAELCANCHKSTTDEWKASQHNKSGIQCENCHNPHEQKPLAPTVTELCTNCHKENSESFTHGTHAQSGLECSNCHMYSAPRSGSPIGGLVATGHTFSVGSEACVGCHQDTVHSRDEIVKLSGEINKVEVTNIDDLEKQIHDQESEIASLKQQNTVRLYTGLMQGAIIGLLTGSVAAWIIGKRVRMVEVAENE